MFAFIKRLLTPSSPPPPVPPPTRQNPPRLEVIDGGQAAGSPFDAWLALTGQEPPAPVNRTPMEVQEDNELAAQVLVHHRQNRLGPSSVPAVSLRVLNAVANSEVTVQELTRLIAQDAALSAGILTVANSPVYAGVQKVETLRDAVMRLGFTEVGRAAGAVAARTLFQPSLKSEFAVMGTRWDDLFAEAVTGARAAAWLALRVRGAKSDHCYMAGVLLDLGRSVALRSVAALALAGKVDPQDPRVDRVVEQVHCEIGNGVHADCGLPDSTARIALLHHALDLGEGKENIDLHVVRLCAALVQLKRQSWRADEVRAEVNESCAALKLDAYVLRALDTQIRTELETVLASFHHQALP
ncbi:MAG: HDOD domain-containing protein [Myxococcota bacterium]